MRKHFIAVRGENARPNSNSAVVTPPADKQTNRWLQVQRKKKLSPSKLVDMTRRNLLGGALQVAKHATNSYRRSAPAMLQNSSTRYPKSRLSEKEIDTFLSRAKKFGPSENSLYSLDELKALKKRFTDARDPGFSCSHDLFNNLDLNTAKLMHEACSSKSTMLRKMISCGHAVTLEKDGNTMYKIVLHLSRQLDRRHEMKLKEVCAKHKCEGFASWLRGETGWRYGKNFSEWGQFIVARLNDLQSVVKECAPPDLLYCFPGESKYLIWCRKKDLWRCVIDIRFFVERVTKKNLPDTPSARRLKRRLLQNSEDGPDAAMVHWAHHDPQNDYPLTVVTEESMIRLVELLVELLLYVLPNEAEEELNGILAAVKEKKKQGNV